ncbi:MAG: aminotransferase class I/II-fold pyridoxal phosphate-dependent enzyme [Pyrinomonadaceae bacterium]|nr:aminotransferase class I/II-fold pyridoxal phosphate-dependent enzyme [Pyrinomonadaceae bacterium]MDQ3134559.1 aminotransferase class I/II-fold pyridoxal phosphate-dependent enzyme [Acidobacteriota bacterium]
MKQAQQKTVKRERELELLTQLVHAGERLPQLPGTPVATPVYTTTTYSYDTMAEVDRVFAGDQPGYAYSRFGNPTVSALEAAMQTLERGAGACAYGSGMAAIHASLLACDLTPGAIVLAAQDLYGTTTNLLHTVFGKLGVQTVMVDFGDVEQLEAIARQVRPRALIAETISNPLLKVCDIEACAEVAHGVGARLIIDNTFASPYLCQPLRFGADIVAHSATKYLSGHGDATGGVAVARDEETMEGLTQARNLIGGVLSVWEAHEILRGVKTLGVRLDRQCANARQLAEQLARHPRVARVYHPGLGIKGKNCQLASRMLRAPHTGALVSIELRENTKAAAYRFMDALQLCVRLTSLGDVVTCVLHPVTASHRNIPPAHRQQIGITDSLVRISVGIEDLGDIIADIEQALQAV